MGEVLDRLAEAVTIRDLDGNIAYGNRAALSSMGFDSLEEMQARPSRSIMDEYLVEDENGAPLTLDDVPSIRMMAGRPGPPLLMRTTHRRTGTVHWRQLKASPILDERGELIAVVTVIEDVTAVKKAEIRMRVLAESGRILASSLDYGQTLRNVADAAVPDLADWCTVDLVDHGRPVGHTVVAHREPDRIALAERIREFEPDRFRAGGALRRVLATGRSELYPEVTADMLARGARSAEHRALLRRLDIRSVLIVPMSVPARTIGVIMLVSAESRRRLDHEDLELAEQLARRAAVAVENARLHTMLSRIAATLQSSLRPEALPAVPGWELASLYRPAGGEQRVDVGGDFYDVFARGDSWFALIGDVTGKGVAAAALTALLRHGSRFASRYEQHPARILRELDDALRSRSGESMCTALCLRLRDREVTLSSAGHPPALHRRADGEIAEVPEPGPLLGAFDDAAWPEQLVTVRPDEMLLLYTDGVTETPGSGERFGVGRLRALLAQHSGGGPAELVGRLDAALQGFRGDAPADDVAALALRASG